MKQITVVVVGAGNRGDVYASHALRHPDELKVVGLVEPDPERMAYMKARYSVPDENCFSSVECFVKRDKFADAVINGTMDHLHVQTSIPILEKGYDMLLEKPFAVNEKEMMELLNVVNTEKRKVLIGHVLRYTPFYKAIKEHVLHGDIGKIISIEMHEHVGYEHYSFGYVRGPWRSEEVCKTPFLLGKSCHDIDIMMWMLKDTVPVSVSSFGGDFQFVPSMKPEGATERCTDCPYMDSCRFSAVNSYAEFGRWNHFVFADANLTKEEKVRALSKENPYGICAWDFENGGNPDHQSVIVNFANGATGVFNLVGGAAKASRRIHIIGTTGEIEGSLREGKYTLRKTLSAKDPFYSEKEYDINLADPNGFTAGHHGGDERLMIDFVNYMNGMNASISCTEINDSMLSHLVVYKAEESRKSGQTVKIVL